MLTAKDAEALVKHLKAEGKPKSEIVRQLAELCLDWPYVYAAAGEMCTPEWRKNRMQYSDEKYAAAIRNACPVLSGEKKAITDPYKGNAITTTSCSGCKWDGCRCFDCRGFTRWLLGQAGITLAGGGATSQWGTASNWAATGPIDTMPKSLVCCVFKRRDGRMSHTGMSMGDGTGGVIHCSTTVKRGNAFTDPSPWTHWGIPAGLYSTEELKKAGLDVSESKNVPTLRRGDKGPAVIVLQNLLNQWGANLNADGVFGAKTEAAVKDFQSTHKLAVDGIVGSKTRAILDPLGLIGEAGGAQSEETVSSDDFEKMPVSDGTVHMTARDFREICTAISSIASILKKYE